MTSLPPESQDPLIGQTVLGYLVKGQIGAGGMGVVFEGEQPVIGKRVAIKVLRAEMARDPDLVRRLVSEARAVNEVGHRGIIDVFAYQQLPDGRHCIVMEFLDGDPLDQVIEAHHESGTLLALSDALLLLQESLGALAAAHSAGVVHRDLKPSNIYLCRQRNGTRYVKLLDFGIAKLGLNSLDVNAARASMMVGTPSYMAPEQANGGVVGPALDLYAMGVMSFELLTGRLPFLANTVMETLMAHAQMPPPNPRALNPQIPEALSDLVLEMLAKDPARRPPSSQNVADRIEAIREELLTTLPTPGSAAAKRGFSPSLDAIVIARRVSLTEMPAVQVSGADDPPELGMDQTHASNPRLKAIRDTASERRAETIPPQALNRATDAPITNLPVRDRSPSIEPAAAPVATAAPAPASRARWPIMLAASLLAILVAGAALWSPSTPAPSVPQVPRQEAPPVAVKVEAVTPAPEKPVLPEPQHPADTAQPAVSDPPAEPPLAKTPAVDVKPTPVTPIPAPKAGIAKSPAGPSAQERLEQRVSALEERLRKAEASGTDVTFERKTLGLVRAKLTRGLNTEARERLEAAVQRMEESANY